jgi:hypothetical protein
VRPLTDYEHAVYALVRDDTGRTSSDGGPWERAWIAPRSASVSRAMGELHRRGLIECKRGRSRSKLGPHYRLRREL